MCIHGPTKGAWPVSWSIAWSFMSHIGAFWPVQNGTLCLEIETLEPWPWASKQSCRYGGQGSSMHLYTRNAPNNKKIRYSRHGRVVLRFYALVIIRKLDFLWDVIITAVFEVIEVTSIKLVADLLHPGMVVGGNLGTRVVTYTWSECMSCCILLLIPANIDSTVDVLLITTVSGLQNTWSHGAQPSPSYFL